MDELLDGVHDMFIRICGPLVPSESPVTVPATSCPLVVSLQFTTLDGVKKKWASLALSCTTEEAGRSLT